MLPGNTPHRIPTAFRTAPEAAPVVLFDVTGKYRPVNMSEHVDFVQYYDANIKDPQPANPAQTMADDIRGFLDSEFAAPRLQSDATVPQEEWAK